MKNRCIVWILSIVIALLLVPAYGFADTSINQNPTDYIDPSDPSAVAGGNESTDSGLESQEQLNSNESTSDHSASSESTEASSSTVTSTTDAQTETETQAESQISTQATTAWKVPSGYQTMKLSLCKKIDGTMFDLRANAKQKLYGYDTLQGACAYHGYGYFILFNRNNNYDKIVKVRLSDMTVVKVSGSIKLNHANGITYNTRKGLIVIAESTPKPKRVSFVNAKTLKLSYRKYVKVSSSTKGMSYYERKKFSGIGAIAYNYRYNCYVAYTRGSHNLLILNTSMKATKQIKQKSKISYTYQDIDTYKSCIMVCQSFTAKKPYNKISVYDFKGRLKARYTKSIGDGKEMETVFHDGSQFYGGFYRSYWASDDEGKPYVMRMNYIYKITNL